MRRFLHFLIVAIIFGLSINTLFADPPKQPSLAGTLANLDFAIYAPSDLIVSGQPAPGKIVLRSIDPSGKWVYYPSGTTKSERDLYRQQGNGNLVSTSMMQIKSRGDTSSPTLQTFVIIEQTSENCTFTNKTHFISNKPAFIYRISFERARADADTQIIRPVDICTQHANELTAVFSDPVNNFLLPIEFISYDSDGNRGSRVKVYIPLA